MHHTITEADVHELVRMVRRDFPGFRQRVPLRVAQQPKDLEVGIVEPSYGGEGRTAGGGVVFFDGRPSNEWAGRTCAVCRYPFALLDHWERRRGGPTVHRRCVNRAGEIPRWVSAATISGWLYRAGATYAGQPVTPGVSIEFAVGDLPHGIAAGITPSNRGLLYGPDGEVFRGNAQIGAVT